MQKFIFGMVHTLSSRAYTPHAIESFLKNTPHSFTLNLIDNSYDLELASSLPKTDRINLITRERPFSFAQNANSLAKLALNQKKGLFFLNNDIIFSKNWLSPFLENYDSIQIPASNNQYQYKSASLTLQFTLSLSDYLDKEHEFEAIAQAHHEKKHGLIPYHSVPYYCVHLPYFVLKTVGLFDERYSPYGWEDTDYTVRAYREGIPVIINSNSYILHFYGKSTWKKDGESITQGDKHCSELFIEKWGMELANVFGFQTSPLLKSIEKVPKDELAEHLKKIILKYS